MGKKRLAMTVVAVAAIDGRRVTGSACRSGMLGAAVCDDVIRRGLDSAALVPAAARRKAAWVPGPGRSIAAEKNYSRSIAGVLLDVAEQFPELNDADRAKRACLAAELMEHETPRAEGFDRSTAPRGAASVRAALATRYPGRKLGGGGVVCGRVGGRARILPPHLSLPELATDDVLRARHRVRALSTQLGVHAGRPPVGRDRQRLAAKSSALLARLDAFHCDLAVADAAARDGLSGSPEEAVERAEERDKLFFEQPVCRHYDLLVLKKSTEHAYTLADLVLLVDAQAGALLFDASVTRACCGR